MPVNTKIYNLVKPAGGFYNFRSGIDERGIKTLFVSMFSNMALDVDTTDGGIMRVMFKGSQFQMDAYAGPIIGGAYAQPKSVFSPDRPFNLSGDFQLEFETYNDAGVAQDASGRLMLILTYEN